MSEQPTEDTDHVGRLWMFADRDAQDTSKLRSSRPQPRIAQALVVLGGIASTAGATVLGAFAAAPTTPVLISISTALFVLAAVLLTGGFVLAGDELSKFLIRGLRVTGQLTHIVAICVSVISCLIAAALLTVSSVYPNQHRSFPAVAALAVVGALSAEIAVMTTPPLVSTGTRSGHVSGTISAILLFFGMFLAITAAVFALAHNGISQNLPTALALFALLFGWVWAVHRDSVKRRDEFDAALTDVLVAFSTADNYTAAILKLEAVILKQEGRPFATTPPPLTEALRATLFYSLNTVTGLVPHQLTIRQQIEFQNRLPAASIDRDDVWVFLNRLRLRSLLGAPGLRAYDYRTQSAAEG